MSKIIAEWVQIYSSNMILYIYNINFGLTAAFLQYVPILCVYVSTVT